MASPLPQDQLLKLEHEILAKDSDSEFEFRYLRKDDFDKGYLD
jgi:hypothetical protein